MARIGLRVAVTATLFVVAAPSFAFSIAARRSHDADLACDTTRSFLAGIVSGQTRELPVSLTVHTDDLGAVGYDGRDALMRSLSTHDGRADKEPAKLVRLVRLHASRFDPIYLARIERTIWRTDRFTGEDANGESERLPPGYDSHTSFWIVAFSSNAISSFRQADELYELARTGSDRCPRVVSQNKG